MSDAETGNHGGSSEASNAESPSERRHHLRFPFTASVEAIEHQTKAKLIARTSDLGLGGCYVDTLNPYAVGTIIKIRLTKDKITFEADAEVSFTQAGMGMGVTFISAKSRQVQIVQKWLNELTGKTSPELVSPEELEADAVVVNSTKNPDLVLRELLMALMRKEVLSTVEGEAMLQKLHR